MKAAFHGRLLGTAGMTTLAALLLSACAARPDTSAMNICRTPDGFVYRMSETAPPPAPAPDKDKGAGGKGIGGTGIRYATKQAPGGKGIGGTGIRLAEGGKGIGGTGIKFEGGIAVQGRITGFGSICVNGLEIRYDRNTPVRNAGKSVSAGQLRIGQVVALVADQVKGGIVARNISVTHVLSGAVERFDLKRNTVRVAGRVVHVPDAATLSRTISAGEHVSVGGFRNAGGEIIASSVEKQPESAKPGVPEALPLGNVRHFALQGYVTSVSAAHEVRLNDSTLVTLPDRVHVEGGKAGDIGPDDRIIVFGQTDNEGRLQAETVVMERSDFTFDAPDHDRGGILNFLSIEPKAGESHDGGDHDAPDVKETVSAPEIEKVEVEKPEIEDHEVEVPEIESPEVESPEVETPDIETPEIESPEIEEPEVETPEIRMLERD